MMGELMLQQVSCVLTYARLVRRWDMTGSMLGILRGHTDYVYEVVLGDNGDLMSCGEDHSVVRLALTINAPESELSQRIWRGKVLNKHH